MEIHPQAKNCGKVAALYAIGIPVLFVIILLIPFTREAFERFTQQHPYISGFIKFALLSTAGEILAGAMTKRLFKIPYALFARMLCWGVLGIVITLVFKLFGAGVATLLQMGYLPGEGSVFLTALWTSVCMNLFFAPTMMGSHRIFDAWLDLREEKAPSSLANSARKVDWARFVSFVCVKTVPLFWIPAHTITFLLPDQYRVMVAAFLSIALGAILALASKPKQATK